MPRPRTDTVQITMRIPRAWLELADALAAERLSLPGWQASRTDAFRAAIARGLGALEKEKKR